MSTKPNLVKSGKYGVLSVGELSRTGKTRDTIASEQQLKAMTDRADDEKAFANAKNFQTPTKDEQTAAETISKNVTSTNPNVAQRPRTRSSDKNPELFGLAKIAAEEKKKECSQSNSSYFSSCTVSGGKRRKTRKHKGSRKNKKSRRR